MLNKKKICVVLPAYNAEKTLHLTYKEIPLNIVDDVLLVDDASNDGTAAIAKKLGINTIIHLENKGYGANQKSCYKAALAKKADIIIMLHPDYQYTPKLITAIASMIAHGVYDVVLASRILGQSALGQGMPIYKFLANRLLTFIQNILMFQKLSEYHTGYRAFSRKVLSSLPLENNSDDFIFDNEIIAQVCKMKFKIGEISCPTNYFPEASSINFSRSIKYGFGVLGVSLKYFLSLIGIKFNIFHGGKFAGKQKSNRR